MTDPTESPAARPRVLATPLRLLELVVRPFQWLLPWPRPPKDPHALDERIAAVQLDLLKAELEKHGDGVGTHVPERDEEAYLYRPGRLLVRSEKVDELRRYFSEREEQFGGSGDHTTLVPGLDAYFLPDRADVELVLADLEQLDDFEDDLARPDHVLYVTGNGIGKLCPAIEPQVPPRGSGPVPRPSEEVGLGRGVRVSVVDTGLWEPAETNGISTWLGPVDGADLVDGETDTGISAPGAKQQGEIKSYAGHGTFVAGVVRCIAPATEIRHEAILVKAGAAYESDIAQQLNDAVLAKFEPNVISISAGTYTRKDKGLLSFEVLWRAEHEREVSGAVLVVAAAGNDSTERPFFPAAYRWVVGVGSLDEDGSVSWFSNRGDWVDVYAHGNNLINAFPSGTYRYHEPPYAPRTKQFNGLARWSGTSFSTPIVSGEIAAHMTRTNLTASEAKDDLLANKSRTVTDASGQDIVAVGPPFA